MQELASFSGSGNTLSGRVASPATKGKEKEKEKEKEKAPVKEKEVKWGAGHTLGARSAATFVPPSFRSEMGSGARPSRPVGNGGKQKKKERSPSPDWGVDDDDVIMIDSD
jgi:ubiquitin fusion degradation protein 1